MAASSLSNLNRPFRIPSSIFIAPRKKEEISKMTSSETIQILKPKEEEEEISEISDLESRPSTSVSSVPNQPSLTIAGGKRKLHNLHVSIPNKATAKKTLSDAEVIYGVIYTENCKKKHKLVADGVLVLKGPRAVLKSIEGKDVYSRLLPPNLAAGLRIGSEIDVGRFTVELTRVVPNEEFLSGMVFISNSANDEKESAPAFKKKKTNPKTVKHEDVPSPALPLLSHLSAARTAYVAPRKTSNAQMDTTIPRLPVAPVVVSTSRLKDALYNPLLPNALVLNAPDAGLCKDESSSINYVVAPDALRRADVPIVVDPYICKHLRPHQRQGVQFMFDCILGRRLPNSRGCLLADDMGLGKTIQTIALVWTLLNQGPKGSAVFNRVLIVVPATLVENWEREFLKWLGNERLRVTSISSGGTKAEQNQTMTDFSLTTSRPVLIISYDLFRKHMKSLESIEIGLVICDEGHRLKNSDGNKTVDGLNMLPTKCRIILTGTPLQNNLSELFAMCNFVNPGVLGGLAAFRNTFSIPIERSRDKNCSSDERLIGDARAKELARLCSAFVLRRTRAINQQFLPPRIEQLVFCRLSQLQIKLYRQILAQSRTPLSHGGNEPSSLGTQTLQTLSTLRKLCSHPLFLFPSALRDNKDCNSRFFGSLKLFPQSYETSASNLNLSEESDNESEQTSTPSCVANLEKLETLLHISHSGKLLALDLLLKQIRSETPDDRVVIVSNMTSTLDLISRLCELRSYPLLRLDGKVPSSLRVGLVNRFNSAYSQEFAFLLSAKAGGVGLNLIGANRIILFDPDWNPATDEQVMGRCWRDGQKKSVFIYRLLSIGTLEECMFQRQLKKSEFNIVEAGDASSSSNAVSVRHFSAEELRDIFTLADHVDYCRTFDLLQETFGESASISSHRGDWQFAVDPASVEDDGPLQSLFAAERNLLSCVAVRRVKPIQSDSASSPAVEVDEQLLLDMSSSVSEEKDE